MTEEEKAYNKAGEALVDWVEDSEQSGVSSLELCALFLDKALDLCFYTLGTEQSQRAVEDMMRDKVQKYSEDPSLN